MISAKHLKTRVDLKVGTTTRSQRAFLCQNEALKDMLQSGRPDWPLRFNRPRDMVHEWAHDLGFWGPLLKVMVQGTARRDKSRQWSGLSRLGHESYGRVAGRPR